MILMIIFCNRNSLSLSVIDSEGGKTNGINKIKLKETDLS